MTTTATKGTCNAGIVREASAIGARTSEKRARIATSIARISLLEFGQLVSYSLIAFGKLVEAFLSILEERLQRSDVAIA